MRKLFLTMALLVLAGLAVFFFYLPQRFDRSTNSVALAPPYQAGERARALHRKLFVADLHGDTLLWSRDLLRRHDYGHADLPRLKDGGVSLQVFATVTKSPRGQNFTSNRADTDNITLLAIAQRWPVRTWGSLLERALYQGDRLHRAAAASEGRMRVVRSRADLAAALGEPAPAGGRLAALLATEGLHPLEGRFGNVERLYDAGFRIAGLTHFFDNELGGSAHGLDKGGLTPFGKAVVRELEDRRMVVDLAHASPRVIDDVLAQARRPVLVSHTGVQGTCPGARNLSDRHIRGIAANGGLIGIGYFNGAVCALDIAAVVKAMRYTTDLVGVQHVALGSDFDGATRTAIDTTGLVLITQALLDAKFSEDEVAAIMGGNVRRFLLQNLP